MLVPKKTFIVAEVGNVHEGSMGLAKKMIEAVAKTGADAVKFQTHIFEAESLKNAPAASWFKGESRESYLTRTAFNIEQHKELKEFAENLGLEFFSAAFSIKAIDLLERIGVKIHKVPSGDVSNVPYLERLAKTGKKVFLSSGMSSWQEIDEAVKTLKDNGCKDLIILQCTTKMPCPPEEAGLNVMLEMKKRYNLPVGISDHTQSIAIPVAAVVLGAKVIEKHFTLSRLMYGSDAPYARTPREFKYMVDCIRETEKALSLKLNKDKIAEELKETKVVFEKSIVSTRDVKAGTEIKKEDLAYKKPGDGIPAKDYEKVIGKIVKKDIPKDIQIKWEYLK